MSGVRPGAWHHFAVFVMGCSHNETLLVRSSDDACKFVATFNLYGTAANYLSYLKGACAYRNLNTQWFDEAVS